MILTIVDDTAFFVKVSFVSLKDVSKTVQERRTDILPYVPDVLSLGVVFVAISTQSIFIGRHKHGQGQDTAEEEDVAVVAIEGTIDKANDVVFFFQEETKVPTQRN